MSRRIKGITIEIGGETTKLEKSLQSVYDKSRGLTREMKEVNRALRFNPKNVELTAQKQKILKEQVENTRKRLNELKSAQEQVNEQYRKGEIGEEQYRAFQREIIETESILKAYESQLSEISDKHKIIGKTMEEIGGKMQDVGGKMVDVGKSLTMKLTTPIVGIATAASKLGIDFEKSMSEVAAVSGATGDELAQLEKAARDAGATTDKSARDAADALQYMALAGWGVEESQQALMPMLKLSSAANMDLGRTSDLVTDTMSVLNLEINDLEHYLDVLAQTSRNSNTDVDQLGESFLVVGGKLTQLGVDVEDGAVALGLLADNGIKGSEAGRGLNAVLTNLTAPTGRAKEALEELGISAFDSNGEFIGIEETLQLVQDATSGMTDEQQNLYLSMIAGKEHSKTLNALMSELGTGFDELSGNVSGADGALEEMYDTATDNTMGALNNLRSAVEELGLKLFENLQPAIEKITGAVQGFVDKLNSLTPKQQEMVVQVGLMVAALGPALIVFGKVVGAVGSLIAIGGKLIGGFGAIAGAAAWLVSPVGLATAGIGLMVGAGVGLVKHLKKDAIPEINLFGDEVSDSTAQAVGAFFDMTEDANTALKELAWSQQTVTTEMAEDMRGKQQGITDNLLGAIESRHEQESKMMEEQFANLELLSDESKEKALVRLDEHYGDEYGKTKEAHDRINEIIATAEAEGREIRSHEAKEIEKIRGEMNNQAVEMMSQSALEQNAILEQMKINSETITAQEAAEVVRNATEKKDAVLQEANKQYDETVAWAIQQRDETGILSNEEADAIIFNAKLQRDEAVTAAEETHQNVVAEAKAQAGEHVNEVDWSTGEILSKWEVFKNKVSKKWSQISSDASTKWSEISTSVINKATELKTGVVNKFNELKNDALAKWNETKSNASTKWNEIKTAITQPIKNAKDTISGYVDSIKGFFSNMKLRIPSIKLPKMPKPSISGRFSINPPSVPKLSWNAAGGILTRPGIFGAMGNTLLAGGEYRTGGEAIMPLNRLPKLMAEAMDMANRTQKQEMNHGNSDVLIEGDTYEIYLTANGDLPDSTIRTMARKIEQEIKNANDRKKASQGERVSFG